MSEKIDDMGSPYKEPSVLNTISFGASGFWSMFAYSVFGAYFFFFYEVAIGLNAIFIATAMIIFTIWDAVNDPLIGYLTDRITKLTRRFGKRFPWIIIGIIPANFMFALMFMPPMVDAASNPMPIFLWIVVTTCLFDSLATLCLVNVESLFPDKFRNGKARRRARGWGTPLSMIALPVSAIIPPLMITFDDPASYIPMAFLCVGILTVVSILFLPGMWENKEIIDRYYVSKTKPETFIAALKSTLKQKSFRYYIIIFFGFVVVTNSLTASIPYAVFVVLQGDESDAILLFAMFLNGALISVPFWIYINKRLNNNKKSAVIGGITLTCGSFITFFYTGVYDSMVYIFILGFTMGNLWTLTGVYFADVLDERVALTRSPVRGTTVGVLSFFNRLSRGAQIAIFAIVHILTGFVAGSQNQTELAKLGIRLHMSVIPAIILLICTIIFWKRYPLTPEKSLEIKKQIRELGF
jgi:GPH family glycoside/pentoside/hexuronide:cation symporter